MQNLFNAVVGLLVILCVCGIVSLHRQTVELNAKYAFLAEKK